MSLSKEQFFKNSVWTFLELTLYPILMIVATPVFIKKLGIEQYGLWMLVNTITLGVNALNIGVGDTNIRLISKYRAESNFMLIKHVFNYNFSLSLFLCLSAALLGLFFYNFNFISIFYTATDYSFSNTMLLLACLSSGLKFVEVAMLSVFKAFERFDINSRLSILSKNSVMVANLVMVSLAYDLIEIFKISLLITFINLIIQGLVLFNFQKNIFGLPTLGFFKEKLAELNYNFWYWLQSVVALLGFLSDKLLVAYFTDVKTLGYYSIASLIGSQIHNFFLSFGSFIFPRVSYKLAENRDVAQIYYASRSIIALLGWTIIFILIISGDFIFGLWLDAETCARSIYFIKLYLVFEAGMLLIIVPFYFINGTQHIRLNSLFEILIRSMHFISMFIGFYLAGVNGLVYGLILSTFLNIPFQYYCFHKWIIPLPGSKEFLKVILPVVFLLMLILSNELVFQLSSIIGFIITCKLIYFDPAKYNSQNFIVFNRFFGKLENK